MFGVARVAGQLAVSRAIGDIDYKIHGVTAEPDTEFYTDKNDLKFIVCACDGLYDVMSNEDIDIAVRSIIGNLEIEKLNERHQLIARAMRLYCKCKVKEADNVLLATGISSFMNFMVCKAPDSQQNLAARIATALTRCAYILGSMDNITAIVLINEENAQQFEETQIEE